MKKNHPMLHGFEGAQSFPDNEPWEIDPDALEQAKTTLGITRPVEITFDYRDIEPSPHIRVKLDIAATKLIEAGFADNMVDGANLAILIVKGRRGAYASSMDVKWNGQICKHTVWISTMQSAQEATGAIWHELMHVRQFERDGTYAKAMVRANREAKLDYMRQPQEEQAFRAMFLFGPRHPIAVAR